VANSRGFYQKNNGRKQTLDFFRTMQKKTDATKISNLIGKNGEIFQMIELDSFPETVTAAIKRFKNYIRLRQIRNYCFDHGFPKKKLRN
jgi:hypothetical protein